MKILILWSPRESEWTILERCPQIAQGLLYGDSVHIFGPQSDDLMECSDYSDLAHGGWAYETTLSELWIYNASEKQTVGLARALIADAESLAAAGATGEARKRLRAAHIALTFEGGQHAFDLPPLKEFAASTIGEVQFSSSAVGTILRESPRKIISNFSDAEIDSVSDVGLHFDFCYSAQESGTYAVVDDYQGYWATKAGRDAVLAPTSEARAAHATVALGQIRELPAIGRLSWEHVIQARETLDGPLARFRGAMSEISTARPDTHVLDPDFEEFVRNAWLSKVNPALAELEELSRQASLREVFFNDIGGKLTTYAGPAIALVAGDLTQLPAVATGTAAVLAPIASAIAASRSKKNALRTNHYFFLHALNQQLRKDPPSYVY